jgi:hypothetical protein
MQSSLGLIVSGLREILPLPLLAFIQEAGLATVLGGYKVDTDLIED